MHELGITQNVVDIVSEHAKGQRVIRVALEIGKLSAIMPDAIRFCFDVCVQDTVMEGAQLEIREIPGLGRCRDCGANVELEDLFSVCDCGSRRIECIAGEDMRIKEMEIV